MNKVNGNILKWARESAGLSLEDAARKLNIKDTKKASATERSVPMSVMKNHYHTRC